MCNLSKLFCLFGLLLSQGLLASDTGSVCVAPVEEPTAGVKSLANPSGGNKNHSYAVQIDNSSPVDVSPDHGVSIAELSLAGRHLVKINDGGKRVSSFHFRFSEYSKHNLCLWLNPLYQTWSLTASNGNRKTCPCP
jgi:hypothetical protein